MLNIICEDARWIVPQDLEVVMNHTFKTIGFKPVCEINLIFGNNEHIQSLNRQYRKKDSPTDVLAFPLFEKKDLDDVWHKEKIKITLGDIILSFEIVEQEAKNFDHHLKHLFVHGVLHLLGYDHIYDNDAEIMESLEVHILKSFDIPNPYL